MEFKKHFGTFCMAALGMATGYGVIAQADRWIPSAMAYDGIQNQISTQGLELVDAQGQRQAMMATSGEGTPAMWLFDKQGKARICVGVYGDGNAGIVLNDENEQAVQIFRTVGSKNDPVLVMKSQGRDRIIMGLNSTQHDPFLVLYDQNGAKQTVFGSY